METSLAIWCAVAALMVVVIMTRMYLSLRCKMAERGKRRLHLKRIISIGTERESIWMPGDSLVSKRHINDYDDD